MSILRAGASAPRSRLDLACDILLAAIVTAALLTMQALIGGGRFVYALPAYALVALAGALSLLSLGATRPSSDRICFLSAAVFFGYVILRAIFSPAPYLARTDIALVLGALVVYGLTSCYLTSAKTRMSILAFLLAAALAHVLVGVIQFRNGNNFMPLHFLQRFDYGRRASGFYICPDHLAGLLEVLGIFGLSIVCWSRWPVWGKLLVGYATAVCYFGVLITGSRGGFLSVIASLFVFAWLSIRVLRSAGDTKLFVKIGTAGAIALLLGVVALVFLVRQSDSLRERTTTALAARDFRFAAWQAAVQQWKLQPLLGSGSRTYLFYGRKFRAERMQRDPVYAHNDYLQLLAEYGIVGLGACAIFLGAHLRRGWIDARRLGPKRVAISQRLVSNAMAVNTGALGAFTAYAVHSLVDFNLHIPANGLLLAFVFGVLANAGVTFDQTTREHARNDFAARGIIVIIAVSLGIIVWRVAPSEYFGERARVMLRDRRFLGAIAYAKQATAADPKNPELFYTLGRARTIGGDFQRDRAAALSYYAAAAPAFERARALAPLDEKYAVELALTYDNLERFAEAEWMFGEARALDPRSTSIREYYRVHLQRWADAGKIDNRKPD
jgi:O-antigen ligase